MPVKDPKKKKVKINNLLNNVTSRKHEISLGGSLKQDSIIKIM